MRSYIGLAALVLMLATACVQAAPAPWRTWQPPAVTYPHPNAFDTYQKAFAEIDKIDAAHGYSRVPKTIAEGEREIGRKWWDVGPPDVPLAQRIKLFAPVYDLVAKALTQPCRLPAMVSNEQDTSYYGRFFDLADLLAMRAHVATTQGRYAAAASSALDAMVMGQQVVTGRWGVALMNGEGCEGTGLRALDEAIPHLDRAGCAKALHRLQAVDRMRLPVSDIFDGDEVVDRCAFKELMAHPEEVASWFNDPKMTPRARARLLAKMRAGSWQALTEYWDAWRAELAKPYSERRALPESTDPFLADTPAVSIYWRWDARARAQAALREVYLAARCYKFDKGRFPSSLQDLVPTYLAAIPTDPFSGKPLLLKPGGGFAVYSVGPDCTDDGGNPPQGHYRQGAVGDIVYPPPPPP